MLLTGNGPSAKDGGWAFCSGGDQRIRGRDGYKYEGGDPSTGSGTGGGSGADSALGRAADPRQHPSAACTSSRCSG